MAISFRWTIGQSVKQANQPGFAYGYPILLMQLLMAWLYLSSALVKLRVAGLKYLSPDNFPVLAIYHSLDNLHDTNFKLAFWLPQIRQSLPVIVGLVLLWELAVSPRCVLASFALVDTWVRRHISLDDNVLHELVLSISTGNVFDLRRLGESGRLDQSAAETNLVVS